MTSRGWGQRSKWSLHQIRLNYTTNVLVRKFGRVFRYIDDLLAINDGGEFERHHTEIYPSELELKNAQLGAPNGQILAPQISSSIITIIGVLPGDANRDGQVDILDLVTVGRHFSQEGDKLPGDVNADGQVNILDLVMVVYLEPQISGGKRKKQ